VGKTARNCCAAAGLVLAAITVWAQVAALRTLPGKKADGYLLPNGWRLTPAGRQVELGGLPLRLTAVPGQPYAIATSNGYGTHFLAVIDAVKETVVDRVPIQEGWMGIAVDSAGQTVYASAGSQDRILVYHLKDGRLEHHSEHDAGPDADIPLEAGTFPAGLALDPSGKRLYVTANGANALKVIDLAERKTIAVIPVGNKPYACAVSRDGKRAWVSNWGEDSVAAIDLGEKTVYRTIAVREKPNDLLLDRTGERLFVANGNRNTVSVIDTQAGRAVEEIDIGLLPGAPPGSTPNALALDAAGTTLFIANADNNSLAVVDVSKPGHSTAKGFIPTGWYPTAVAVVAGKLIVANGKGIASRENGTRWNGKKGFRENPGYVANLMPGSLSFIDSPDARTLARYSEAVYRNSPFRTPPTGQAAAPFELGTRCPIRYVFYIIKENRTYDSLLGDMREGNGDPAYCLFPERVTPNHHALAREFVLFDNLYHDADVSADGHHWVTSAYATDYVEKFWPAMYGGKGQHARLDLHDDPAAYSASGFLWDLCARAGLTYRSYGEGARIRFAAAGKVRAATPSLEGHIHPTYYGSDGIAQMRDRRRVELWEQEFREFARDGNMPRFTVMSLPGDHLLGTRRGAQTPSAMMAENDLAVGRIIETLSQSRYWKEMAVFVVEDDTQDGPDHVDVHRAPVLIASPYAKRGMVDGTMYSSSSVLHTMELILGLPPMTQYDSASVPMWAAFQAKPDVRGYTARAPNVDIEEKNLASAYGAKRSREMLLEVADSTDDREYNEIIWKAVRGPASPLPARKVAAFVESRD
jgi:YVTN family beta-propeller protein